MKMFTATVLALIGFAGGAAAQILVEVTLDQPQYLPGESLMAAVRITNRSGQTLSLGGEPDWLTFTVESRDGLVVSKNGEAPVVGEFSLETAKVATKRVDLAPYFSMTKPGRYHVLATVRIKSWGAETASAPKDFDIVKGAKFWEHDFGVPGSAAPGQPPESRKFALLQVTSLRSEIRIYARVSDLAEARLFRLCALGSMVAFGRPEAQVDGRSQLHVLQQNGARSQLYSVVNADGQVVKRQFFDFAGVRPHLEADNDGNISVAGGVRRITPDDLPAEKVAGKPDAR